MLLRRNCSKQIIELVKIELQNKSVHRNCTEVFKKAERWESGMGRIQIVGNGMEKSGIKRKRFAVCKKKG